MSSPSPPDMVTIVVKAGREDVVAGRIEIPRAWLTTPTLKAVGLDHSFKVSGCRDRVEGPVIRGNYLPNGENHGRRVYRRTDLFKELEVLIYYWDDRDGPGNSGWWIGHEVGSSYVCCHCPDHGMMPPRTGWKCPFRSPVDETILVERCEMSEQDSVNDPNPWFQAKLERWQDGQTAPSIALDIPVECDASAGAALALLEMRLRSTFQPKEGKLEAHPVASVWSPLNWFQAAKGQIAALSAVLHIFHMTMMEAEAKEVLSTLSTFRLPCPRAVVTIAGEMKHEVVKAELPASPISVSAKDLRKMVEDACSNGRRNRFNYKSLMALADRAIAGSTPSTEVVKTLVDAWFECFDTDSVVSMFCSEKAPRILPVWLSRNIEALVRRRWEAAYDVVQQVKARLPFKERSRGFDECRLDPAFVQSVWTLLLRCLNVLFVESSLTPEASDAIALAIQSCVSVMYPLRFCTSDSLQRELSRQHLDCEVFAAASLSVQLAFLKHLPSRCYYVFKDRVHLVHEEARHLFVSRAADLSCKDVEFLATASFPGLHGQKRESPDGKEDEQPAAKRAKLAVASSSVPTKKAGLIKKPTVKATAKVKAKSTRL